MFCIPADLTNVVRDALGKGEPFLSAFMSG